MDLNWMLGFFEGEGSFCILLQRIKRETTVPSYFYYVRLQFAFQVAMRDATIVNKIESTLECYDIPAILQLKNQRSNPYTGKRSRFSMLSVKGTANCRRLAHLLDPLEWHTIKRYDFELWMLALDILEKVGARPYKRHQRKWTKQDIFDAMYVRKFMNGSTPNRRALKNLRKVFDWGLTPSPWVHKQISQILPSDLRTSLEDIFNKHLKSKSPPPR